VNGSRKLTIAAAAGAMALATFAAATSGQGGRAGFVARTTDNGTVTVAQKLRLTVDSPASYTVGFSNMLPGDVAQRSLSLTNSSAVDVGAVQLWFSGTPANSPLVDRVHGLHVTVRRCSVPWQRHVPLIGLDCPSTIDIDGDGITDGNPVTGAVDIPLPVAAAPLTVARNLAPERTTNPRANDVNLRFAFRLDTTTREQSGKAVTLKITATAIQRTGKVRS
jgi:hypothetical protein